jgi:adenylate cyclase
VGKGIAGTVGATGQLINIPDAYADPRFDPRHDKATGYRTKSILCCAVCDAGGNIVGVVQAINKLGDGVFTETDEEVINILAAQAGISLQNTRIVKMMSRSKEKVSGTLEIIKAMHSDLGINSLIFTITERAHTIVDADRCTLFIADHHSKELWSIQGEINIRFPIDRGIAGAVATTAETINIPDAYEDKRFNPAFDKKSGYRTKCILAMPILGADGVVVAVIQLINKVESASETFFTEEDEAIISSFVGIAGPIIQNSQLFQRSHDAEEGSEFSGRTKTLVKKPMSTPAVIMEADEEEEDEDDEDEDF